MIKFPGNKKIAVVLIVLAAVVLHSFSFPRFNLFFTAFFFLIPLVYALDSRKTNRAFLLFFTFSLFSYLVILYWIPGIMAKYGNMSKILSILGLILLAAFLSIFTGCAGVLIKKVLNHRDTISSRLPKIFNLSILLIPFIWVGKDLIIERILSGFPWCLSGYSQHNNIYFIQAAEFGGVHLVTFMVIFINILFYLLLRERNRRIIAVLVIVFVTIYTTGYFLYRASESETAVLPVHKAGIIQPNAFNEFVSGSVIQKKLNRLFARSRELTKKGAEFVIWPEYTVGILPMQNINHYNQLRGFARANVPLIAGFNDYFGQDEFYNTAFLFKKDRVEKYYKVHLTPFGEYIPLRKLLFFVENITSEIGDYTPGKSIHNLELNGHTAAIPICYEVIFPELMRDFIAKGSELFVTISNDSWEGDTAGPRQILAMALFRCIENRRCMLRSTSTGISAAVVPTGELAYKSQWDKEEAVVVEFKYLSRKTIFTRWGYLFPYFCIIIAAIYSLAALILRKKKSA